MNNTLSLTSMLLLLIITIMIGNTGPANSQEFTPQEEQIITLESTLPPLNAGDQLRIFVYGDAELTGEYRIDTRGMLTLPLIGEIKTQGLDKNDLEKTISQRLIDGGYYNDPKVSIEISALQPFYILGEVRNPGSYPYSADLDVFKAIATAGGYTPRADKQDITIIRKVNGKKEKLKVSEETELLPGDSIKVEQRFF